MGGGLAASALKRNPHILQEAMKMRNLSEKDLLKSVFRRTAGIGATVGGLAGLAGGAAQDRENKKREELEAFKAELAKERGTSPEGYKPSETMGAGPLVGAGLLGLTGSAIAAHELGPILSDKLKRMAAARRGMSPGEMMGRETTAKNASKRLGAGARMLLR